MFVKICGITRAEDADLAAALGATALGFVFWPGSPRAISAEAAASIARRIDGSVRKVGVFVDQPIEDVMRIIDTVGLDIAQLHGAETPDYCQALVDRPLSVIKSIAVRDGERPLFDGYAPDVLLLIDAHDTSRHGGTGRTVNWEVASVISAARPSLLAGGLTPENVASAISVVQPFGVDVSSGVESAPGVKDPVKLRRFFEALND